MTQQGPALSDFAGHLGGSFHAVPAEGEGLDLELVEAVGITSDTDRKQPFSLLFKGPKQGPLPQQIFTVEHPELGEMAMFLVPMGPDGEGFHRYEAVFN